MPGPLATVARVRELGGLIDSPSLNFLAYNLFGYADDATLVARITTEIAVASAWLQSRGGTDYASGDTVKDTLFAEAESYLALQNLYETLKMRKVLGTHFPYVSEDSQRYEQLIDVEIPGHIQKFIDQYLVTDEVGKPWAAPAMVLGQTVDRTAGAAGSMTSRQLLDDIIDEATALSEPGFPRSLTTGDL